MITETSGYRIVLRNFALTGIYFLLGQLGLWFSVNSVNVILIWPSAGLAVAILLLGGVRYIPGILFGSFATSIAASNSIGVSVSIALGNTLEPLLAWWLLTRYVKFDIRLNKLADFLLILFFVAPLSAVISTVINFLMSENLIPNGLWSSGTLNWWMADVLGTVLVASFILVWQPPLPNPRTIGIQKIFKTLLPIVLAFLAGQIIFLDWFAEHFHLLAKAYLIFPLLGWTAITVGARGVTIVLVITTIQALLGARQGIGYFGTDFTDTHLANLWVFMLTLSIVGMALAIYIAERKQAESALQESETRFRRLLQDIPSVAVQSFGEDGLLHYWNKASERLFGYSSAEATGQDLVKLLLPTTMQYGYRQAIEKMFATTEAMSTSELSLLHKNGSQVDIFAYHAYIHAPGHQPEVFCIAIDMTEYKHVETLLRNNENYLRTLLNTIPDLVWSKNKEGVYLFCNPMFERFLGAKTSDIIGKTDYDFIDQEHANFFRESDLTTIAKGIPHISEETITYVEDNRSALLEIIKAPMYGPEDEIIGVLGIARDVTQRKRMEEKLRASESRLRSIIDVSPVPMALSDRQHKITFLNPAFEQVIGYSIEELPTVTDCWLKIWPDANYRHSAKRSWEAALKKASGNNQPVPPIEFNITCKSGAVKNMLISAAPIEKNFNSSLIVFYDITEHKQITETVMRSEALLRKKDGYQRALLDNFPFMVWFKDTKSRFLAVNQAFARSLGIMDTKQIIGKSDFDFYPADLAEQHQQDDHGVIQSRQKKMLEEEHVDPMGISSWIEIYKAPVIDVNGEMLGTVGFARDITERKNNETDLRIAATAFESQDGMFITDVNRIILRVNRAFTAITGYSAEEVVGQTPMLFNSYHQDDSFYAELWDCIFDSGAWQGEIWTQRKNGDVYLAWLMVTPVKNKNAVVTHYVTEITDITVRKEAEEQIRQFAFYDSLTRLPNRRKLLEHLEHCIAVGKREKGQFALLMLDLDRFKAVNDSFGHLAGDELLQQVAGRVSKRLRNTDTVARLGGDEFVVLLADISHKEDAARVAEMIVSDLTQPFQLNQHGDVQIGTSIGISLYPEHGNTPEMLMDNADVALYQAKNNGRGCFAYFSESLTLATRQRLQLEAKLRKGLSDQELRVYYQPQVDLATGAIIGAEALVRWQSFNQLMPPSYFIPVAEETSLIIDIGAWVLYETCQQGRLWLDEGLPPISLSVNVSSPQIKRGNIVDLVDAVLEQTGFPPEHLILEITERGLMENHDVESVIEILDDLRALGIHLAIDNFGTGYSSLAYLKRFPVDTLKIDRGFINSISDNQDDVGIASTIITMAHSLGFTVLAEGVETPEQLDFLRERGCNFYQGYIKSKPVPAEEFSVLLREQSTMTQ